MRMRMRKLCSLCAAAVAALSGAAAAQEALLSADFTAPKTEVSPNLYGIFYEDINYAADGGLYGEMVQNRSFEFRNARMSPTESWTNVNRSGEKAKAKLKTGKDKPLNKNNPIYGVLTVEQAGDGAANRGYGGMPLEAGKKYPGSVWLRSPDGTVTSVTVAVGAAGKGAKTWTQQIGGVTAEWKKFEFTAVPPETTDKGQIALYPDQTGTLHMDFVSLFRADIYKNEPNGLRKDLAERLEALKPAFVRFPGGCIVHGASLENRYVWKDTVGPVEERKEKMNFWGYEQSYGIGFYEYFRFCEDIGAEPLPVLSVGMAHNGEISPKGDYAAYAQDALDLIEYATGPADSKWGKVRADAGHPEPFRLNYIGVGNEDCGQDYFARYSYIAGAVKAKYPQIKTIISSGYTWNDVNFHNTWRQVREWEKGKKTANLVDLVDEHYYNESNWFLANGNRYDNLDFYPRGEGRAKVFIGEYASWVDGRRNNMYSALTEAAYMTSIERNGDIVEISSYAPLFAKDGKTQWVPDMIWFNNRESYGTPDYYVQQLFSVNRTDRTVKYTVTQPVTETKKSAIGGTVGLGTWLTAAQFRNVKVTDGGTGATVYDSAANSGMDGWRAETGVWSMKKGLITQSSEGENMRAILDNEADVAGIENYTLELEAKKLSGAEGFLIIFGVKGKSLYWWNMGGWGNTQSCVEKGTAAGRSIIGDSQAMSLTPGKWYKIKIEVSGESYKCYLDGKLIHEYTDVMNFDSVYAHVGEKGNKVVIKLVNVAEREQPVRIQLNGVSVAPAGTVTVLSGGFTDENSFASPTKVAPVTEKLSASSSDFVFTAKAGSVSVIELDKK